MHSSPPPDSHFLQYFTKEEPYVGTLTAQSKESALNALTLVTFPLSQASRGTKLPQGKAEPQTSICVLSKAILF